ncbi:MAG: hypothetical protein SNJ54_08280 [Anaerolineae bacterium]
MNIDPIELLMLLLGLFMLVLGPFGLVLSFLFGLLGVGWLG